MPEATPQATSETTTQIIPFNTHRYIKRLIGGGFTEEQAEILADEQVALLNANLATKVDVDRIKEGIESLRQETKREIESLRKETQMGMETLRQETKADIARIEVGIASIKADLLKWMFAALVLQGGLIVALIKL